MSRKKGFKHSKEIRIKMSESGKKKIFKSEHKKNLSIAKKGKNHPMYGKHHSEETKKKISKSETGKNHHFYGKKHTEKTKEKMSQSHIGIKPWNKDIPHSEETKKKMSKVKKGKNYGMCGENHYNWKGGISCEPYCDVWIDKEYKQSIKERDGNKCLNPECNKTTNKLCLHHIDYNKKECKPSNLITLCVSCNSKANKNREWHKSWYQAIINKRYKYK